MNEPTNELVRQAREQSEFCGASECMNGASEQANRQVVPYISQRRFNCHSTRCAETKFTEITVVSRVHGFMIIFKNAIFGPNMK